METKDKNIASLDIWRGMKVGGVRGFGRPKLSATLLDFLTAISQHERLTISTAVGPAQIAFTWSQTVITCDPLAWLTANLTTYPSGLIDIGRIFGRPEIEIPDYSEGPDDDPELYEIWNFYANAVTECVTIHDAVQFIAGTHSVSNRFSDADAEYSSTFMNPKLVESVFIDYSLPFGGKGGAFKELLSAMPGQLSGITALQSHFALMTALLIMDKCKNLQELIMYLPAGSLFQESLTPCRRFLKTQMHLTAVIELPPEALRPSAAISTAVVVLQKKPAHSETLFYSLAQIGELVEIQNQPWLLDLKSSLSGSAPRHGFLARVPPDGQWTSHRYIPGAHTLPKGLLAFSELTRIGDLFNIFSRIRFSRRPADGRTGMPVIRGRDIGKPMLSENLERFAFEADIPDRARAQSGDILLQKVGATPTVSLVQDDLAGTIVGDTVLILRPHSATVSSEAIVQTLISPIGRRLLSTVTQGAGAPTVSIDRLRHLQIPIVSLEVQRQINVARNAEERVRQIASRLTSVRESIFLAESKDEFERNLLSVQTETAVISSSLLASPDISYRVRNFYPFPLAYPYRMLDSIVEAPNLYREQLRIAENIMAFVASVTLALLEESKLKAQLDLKTAFRGGISPGTWCELARSGSGLLTESTAGHLSTALKSLWKRGNRETKFSSNVRELVQIKNAFKHDKEVLLAEEEYTKACARLTDLMAKCVQDLEFFIQHPILLVTNLDVDRRTSLSLIDALKYMGDHPALQQEKFKYPKPLKKNTLFIYIEEHRLESLFPFIVVQHCQRCRYRETYFVDRWDGKQVDLKSFERGHIERNLDVDNDFASYFQ